MEARLASMRQASARRANRRTLLTGLAVGAAGGALVTGLAVTGLSAGSTAPVQEQVPMHVHLLPVYLPAKGLHPPSGQHRLSGG